MYADFSYQFSDIDNAHVQFFFGTQEGDSALMLAAYKGNSECVRLLLEGGAEMNAKNRVRYCITIHLLFMVVIISILSFTKRIACIPYLPCLYPECVFASILSIFSVDASIYVDPYFASLVILIYFLSCPRYKH